MTHIHRIVWLGVLPHGSPITLLPVETVFTHPILLLPWLIMLSSLFYIIYVSLVRLLTRQLCSYLFYGHCVHYTHSEAAFLDGVMEMEMCD